jgi:2-hydroxychromene-2-carboxylate isomerase
VSPDRPIFLYDLASPLCWLAAEEVGGGPVWQPVSLQDLNPDAHAALAQVDRDLVADRAPMPPRWPDPYPADTRAAMLAAAFAKKSGRTVAFSLAAFRQAFAGGKDLTQTDNILISAAACELHPRALLQGLELKSTRTELDAGTDLARDHGVTDLPALVTGDRVDVGLDAVTAAAAAAT